MNRWIVLLGLLVSCATPKTTAKCEAVKFYNVKAEPDHLYVCMYMSKAELACQDYLAFEEAVKERTGR